MTRSTARGTRARRAAAAALLPLSLGALTACGDDDDASAAGSAVSEAAAPLDDVEEGETVEPDVVADLMLASFTEGETVAVEMEMEMMGMEMDADGVASYAGEQSETAMTMSNPMLGDEKMDVRLIGGTIYMNMGSLTGGKFWAVDLDDPDNPLGKSLSQQMDPRAALESMTTAVTKAVYAGDEEVGGESTDRYTLTIDVEEMLAASGLGELGADASAMMPQEVTQDIWFGEDGLVRQAKVTMGDAGSTVMEFSDWGEPVTVEAPPADQVEEMPKLDQLGQLGGQVAG